MSEPTKIITLTSYNDGDNVLTGRYETQLYGSDFMIIVDEDGTEYELEVLSTLEYDGNTYLAVIPAGSEEEDDLEVSILKSVEEEDGEPILCAVEDEIELETVYNLIMDQLYEEEADEE